MIMPGSMDYLMSNGILNFDAQAFLNNPAMQNMPFEAPLNGSVKMQEQPVKDSFMSKTKAAMNTKSFKQIATAGIVAGLALFGLSKFTKGVNVLKGVTSNNAVGNTLSNIKDAATKFIKK